MIRQVDLALLDDYLPALDQGRVEVASPRDWKVMSRSSSHLARFYFADINGPPRIEITVKESPFPEFADVTTQNVVPFATRVAEQLRAEGKEPLEPPLPLVVNGKPCARYVSDLALKYPDGRSVTVERQIMQTVVAGRMYMVDLRVLPGTLEKHRDSAYAVFAGLRFPQAGR